MIKYGFGVAKAARKSVKREEVSYKRQSLLESPRLLSLFKDKLGLLKFLFSKDIINSFYASGYIQMYKQDNTMSKDSKLKVSCLNFLEKEDRYTIGAYLNYLYNQHTWEVIISRELCRLTDLSTPHKWYPEARKMKRKFIYHHGPTNSGKTVSAIKSLEQKQMKQSQGNGIYMAPLRLLAWQIQQRLSPCTLITGQQKIVMDSKLTSCTIETANLKKQYELAVIDEVQMIGDRERGWGWTRALLNTKSEEIHLCGESRPLELISRIVAITGDDLEQRRYPRLSRLLLETKLFRFKDLRPGDCIIAFSTSKLHSIRQQIKKTFGQDVAIIYGKLPPEIRKKQTQAFNNGTLPYLVSTNAIGMGLNLHIKRVIFYETQKIDQMNGPKRPLQEYQIQQIAGRAGRGLVDGYVACMNSKCFTRVRRALKHVNRTYNIQLEQLNNDDKQEQQISENEEDFDHLLKRNLNLYQKSIAQGMLFIEFGHLEQYHYLSSYLNQSQPQRIQLSDTIKSFFEDAKTASHYSIIEAPKFSSTVSNFQGVGLSALDSFNFSNIPCKNQKLHKHLVKELALGFKTRKQVRVPSYLVSKLERELTLRELQETYSLLETYVWLSNKYELAFTEVQLVSAYKQVVCRKIEQKLRDCNSAQRY